MSKTFFIYSLPRSGTAWLSMFLTSKDSFCYHEPLADDDLSRLHRRAEPHVGAVDTGAMFYPGRVALELPDAKCYVIHRDIQQVQKSLDAAGLPFRAADELDRLRQVTRGMTCLEFELFTDVHYLRDVWAELFGTPFDRERAEIFAQMNIQRDIGRFFAARPHLHNALRCH